jgi:hypothetical protein
MPPDFVTPTSCGAAAEIAAPERNSLELGMVA